MEILNEFKKRVLERFGDDVIKITLFGSYSRMEEMEESDIDVLVVVKKRTPILEREIIGIAYDLLMEKGKYVSVKVYGEDEYSKPSPFLEAVLREGTALYG